MFDEYFYPDGDEDDAAEEFDVDAFDFAEAITADYPEQGEREGHKTYHERREINACFQKCHADPDSQSIDAGGDAKRDEGLVGKGRDGGFLLLEGLVNHFAPEKAEQDKRDPMVESGDVRAEADPE